MLGEIMRTLLGAQFRLQHMLVADAFRKARRRRLPAIAAASDGVVGPRIKSRYVKSLTAPRESAISLARAVPTALGSILPMDGAMPSPEIWSKGVPTVELDQRSREARIRLEC